MLLTVTAEVGQISPGNRRNAHVKQCSSTLKLNVAPEASWRQSNSNSVSGSIGVPSRIEPLRAYCAPVGRASRNPLQTLSEVAEMVVRLSRRQGVDGANQLLIFTIPTIVAKLFS
jgi:hypothetical protein